MRTTFTLTVITLLSILVSFGAGASTKEPFHPTSETVDYKCIFNHELLIICHNKTNSAAYIKSFIEKLKDTDVDAIMCCPTAWRTNLFPSEVDPTWEKYRPGQPLSKFRSYDYIMRYLHTGGDPVKETLEACRNSGKDFFISYRMNDHHYVDDLEWPCHNDFWRDHPEYWLGDSNTSPYTKKDNIRLFNYMLPQVRDHYFAIIQELCTNYDVDGVELDFQRFPKFFLQKDLKQGTAVMTAFVKRIRDLLDQLGRKRNKTLRLCIRVPETLAKCRKAGLDVPGWDVAKLIDMINVSSFYFHTMELDIEDFQANTKHAKIYGEMNYVTYPSQRPGPKFPFARRYTTLPIYYASALNLFARGADGLSLFNFDYIPRKQRLPMAEGLKRITDVEYLKTQSKDYVITRNFGSFPAHNEKTVHLIIPDDTKKITFKRALLRVETKADCTKVRLGVWLNGNQLKPCTPKTTTLFPPLAKNKAYVGPEMLQFYTVPLDALIAGENEVKISNPDPKKNGCTLYGMELALYR
jgi:hypothetical protein